MIEISYRQHTITVDDCDADLDTGNWRVHSANGSKYVIRSVPRFPDDWKLRGNEYLHRLIAARMGFAGHQVVFADGNHLNLRRSNLSAGRLNWNRGRGTPKVQPRQPAAAPARPKDEPVCMRRVPLGTHRPAGSYELQAGYLDEDAEDGIRWEAVGYCERVKIPRKDGSGSAAADYWQGHLYSGDGLMAERFPARPKFVTAAADVMAMVPSWDAARSCSVAELYAASQQRREQHREEYSKQRREQDNARNRQRYATDPAYRERILRNSRESYARKRAEREVAA
jgi:hypothetical protein